MALHSSGWAGSSSHRHPSGDKRFQSAIPSPQVINALCESSLLLLHSSLRVHVLSSQRMLLFHRKRKEPVVTGCVGWGVRAFSACLRLSCGNWGRSLDSRPERRLVVSLGQRHSLETVQQEVRGKNKICSFNTSSAQKCAHFLKGFATFIYFVRQPTAYYNEFFCSFPF